MSQQVAGLKIQSHPSAAQVSLLVFEWRSEATGKYITCSTNILDWNPYAMSKTLQDFASFLVKRHKEDLAEAKEAKSKLQLLEAQRFFGPRIK